jgi:hypothetical protein
MSLGGWIILFCSIGGVSVLFIGCLYAVLKTPGETERLHGFEIETPDKKLEHSSEQ